MIKIKKIKLNNFCGYQDFELDFSDSGGIKKWGVFFGPNGIGTSNLIKAIDILTHPKQIKHRSNARFFRNMKYNWNYVPQLRNMQTNVTDLRMEGVFVEGEMEKRVVIEDTFKGMLGINVLDETLSEQEKALREWDRENAVSGVTTDELSPDFPSYSIYIDADNPMSTQKFQIYRELKEPFLDFAESVYGFRCYLPDKNIAVDQGIEYCTDFVLRKPDDTLVHYKSFSDGEKKIATLLSTLFKKAYHASKGKGPEKIILVDNIEMHIYWKRHMTLIQKMEEFFPEHQIIVTTHSPIIVTQMDAKYLYDLEESIGAVV
jgi:predicted ATP-dependent endonuclease of OLD family